MGNFFGDNYGKAEGGAVNAKHTTISVKRASFHGNTAGVGGGAFYLFHSDATFYKTATFYNNTAGKYGGGLYIITSERVNSFAIILAVFDGNRARDGGQCMHFK